MGGRQFSQNRTGTDFVAEFDQSESNFVGTFGVHPRKADTEEGGVNAHGSSFPSHPSFCKTSQREKLHMPVLYG